MRTGRKPTPTLFVPSLPLGLFNASKVPPLHRRRRSQQEQQCGRGGGGGVSQLQGGEEGPAAERGRRRNRAGGGGGREEGGGDQRGGGQGGRGERVGKVRDLKKSKNLKSRQKSNPLLLAGRRGERFARPPTPPLPTARLRKSLRRPLLWKPRGRPPRQPRPLGRR